MRPGAPGRSRDADVALYHVGNDPDAHAWIVDALRRGPVSSSCTISSSTT